MAALGESRHEKICLPTNSDNVCAAVKKSLAAKQAPADCRCENCHNITKYRTFYARIASCCPGVFLCQPRCRSPPPRSDFPAKI